MILSAYALASALSACAPDIYPSTMAAIVEHESGGDPYAIHDNATNRAYLGLTRDVALDTARAFVADGPDSERCRLATRNGRSCTIDVGIAQINSSNFAHYHVVVDQVFDVATNVAIGASILRSAWHTAIDTSHDAYAWRQETATYAAAPDARQVVLRSAISIYNSNSAYRAAGYVEDVIAASESETVEKVTRRALQLRGTAVPCQVGEDFERV